MPVQIFALNNLRWKLTALLLAMLVWFSIKFAIYKGSASGRTQILAQQPVMVLMSPGDPRAFRIHPPQVDLVVQSAKELNPEDLEVFVNLTTLADVDTTFKQVLVRGADAAKVILVKPPGVTVERLAPLDSFLTNTLKK
jgi:hypothetical protein